MQIRMNISTAAADSLPLWTAPDGYLLRKTCASDEEKLPELLSTAGVVEWVDNFDASTMRTYLDIPDRREGSFVVECGEDIVACCFATRWSDAVPAWGVLDYVCVRADHRRKGLGFAVCSSVLRYFRSQGYQAATLTTLPITDDNHQLMAIELYLQIGMRPSRTEENASVCEGIYRELERPVPVDWWDGAMPFSLRST